MRTKLLIASVVIMLLCLGASNALAQNTSLQDLGFNVNGSLSVYPSSTPGVNLGGYNTTTGLGKITYTSNASGYFDVIFVVPVSVPFYNEYGSPSGTPSSGESWEIDNLEYANTSIVADWMGNTLSDGNDAPQGASDNYLDTCDGGTETTVGDCNGLVANALGYAFTVGSGDQESVVVTVSQTAPTSGFYLDQTHPIDGNNAAAQDVYYSLSASESPLSTSPTPEPSTWMLLLTGMGAGATRLRRRFSFKAGSKFLGVLAVAVAGLVMAPFASAQSVNTVPWDPTNPAAPHTTYPLPIGAPTSAPATSEVTIVLGAIFNTGGSTDSFTYSWNFGDGTAATPAANVSNPNDISATHQYPFAAAVGKNWTATVTVTDTKTSKTYTGNYLVIQEANDLQTRVNVAIDFGLWYEHQTMAHPSAGVGYWDSCASGYSGYACSGYTSLTATTVQAFEVNGHLATGPATDPFTLDVQEGLNQMFTELTAVPLASEITYEGVTGASKSYTYNPATANYGCSDGTSPLPGGACDGTATKVYYNASATSCTAPPCKFTFDGNSNGQAVYAFQESGDPYGWGYEDGMFADALVASGNPGGIAGTGGAGIVGKSYATIVQDIADAANFCQWTTDYYDVGNNYYRGYPYGGNTGQGGGWWYDCQEGNDNSVSQWASIGLIGAQRGFGIPIPKIVTDSNNMWVTASQNVQTTDLPVSGNPGEATTDDYGGFGYNGSLYYSDPWSPFATTPSGMVQMSMDGIGRTNNTVFGNPSNAPDQRWNNVETYYADNFCNTTADGSTYAPRAYTYGMFSFTKSMLLHNPLGVLTPIQYLRTMTPNVFTTNNSIPKNTIDWYAALSPANGGTDPCDGVAQTIVERQYGPNNVGYSSSTPGFWYEDNYDGGQYPYETAWSLIMLQRTVFVTCVNNLGGSGTASGANPARVDLTWTGIPNVTGYDILRSPTNGGPYVQVGTTTTTAYSDRTGLTNGDTYYYVLQPVNGTGPVCQSNQATITIPKPLL